MDKQKSAPSHRADSDSASVAKPAQTGAESQAANKGRDARGRFAHGNPGGPGNPFNRQCAALRKALYACATEDVVDAIAAKLTELARDGNLVAMNLFLKYRIGERPRAARSSDPNGPSAPSTTASSAAVAANGESVQSTANGPSAPSTTAPAAAVAANGESARSTANGSSVPSTTASSATVAANGGSERSTPNGPSAPSATGSSAAANGGTEGRSRERRKRILTA